MFRLPLLFAAAVLAVVQARPAVAQQAGRALSVGSGEVTGYYYPVAGAICRLVNKERSSTNLHCLVEPSGGSGANLTGLRLGEIDIAVVQSRAVFQAENGLGPFQAEGPVAGLRSLLSLHAEALAVMVGRDAKIKSAADLKGKRVNLGRAGTFQRTMSDSLLDAFKWTSEDFPPARELDPGQQVSALCDGEIDAAFITGVHPLPEVQRAMDECGATLLSLRGGAIDSHVRKAPYLARVTLPRGLYGGSPEVGTIGFRATLVTTERLSAETAYEVVKAVNENFGPFVGMHPVLGGLKRAEMVKEGLSAPLHEGAARYFREAGLAQ